MKIDSRNGNIVNDNNVIDIHGSLKAYEFNTDNLDENKFGFYMKFLCTAVLHEIQQLSLWNCVHGHNINYNLQTDRIRYGNIHVTYNSSNLRSTLSFSS